MLSIFFEKSGFHCLMLPAFHKKYGHGKKTLMGMTETVHLTIIIVSCNNILLYLSVID